MTFHDPATSYAEALDNLTEENWHTERALIEAEVARKYAVGYDNGESSLLADVNTLCDQLDIDLDGRHEFEAIRAEVETLRAKVAAFEEREEDRRQDWLEKLQ